MPHTLLVSGASGLIGSEVASDFAWELGYRVHERDDFLARDIMQLLRSTIEKIVAAPRRRQPAIKAQSVVAREGAGVMCTH